MHPARPQVPSAVCPSCGAQVDPLRARKVILLPDGFRFFCNSACGERFESGERDHDAVRRSGLECQSQPVPLLDTPAPCQPSVAVDTKPPEQQSEVEAPWIGLGLALGGLLCGSLASNWTLAWLSAICSVASAAVALLAGRRARIDLGMLSWVLAPMGTVLAVAAALVGSESEFAEGLVAGALAAGALNCRVWLEIHSRVPVQDLASNLERALPESVRVPDPSAPEMLDMNVLHVETAKIRTGEEFLTSEGETVAIDGVVRAGTAWALPYPGAKVTIPRTQGDPLLAGARIVEGEVLLRATRVGKDRALVRSAEFDMATGPQAAPLSRIAAQASRAGGILAVATAILIVSLSDAETLSSHMMAAATILIATPVITLRRGTTTPWVAAAATAGYRGIVFQNPKTLESAGKVSIAALCAHGTVTEGRPQVVEVHSIDGSSKKELIGLAVGAEASAEGHPIMAAIARYAKTQNIEPRSVRRAAFQPGRGVTALGPGGEAVVMGNRQLLIEEGISVAVADEEAYRAEARGYTALFCALGGRVRAVFALSDDIRAGARAAVQRLIDLQIEAVLLSGDHRVTIEAMASCLDVTHVKAELTPNERGREVDRLGHSGHVVAVVGHPGQDDEALSAAEVPVVLKAAGGPFGERGIALSSDDLRDATAALWVARAARREAWRAFLLTSSVGLGLAIAGATLMLSPAPAALFAVALDAFVLPGGARLLRRVQLRIPTR
ncbi:MAG: HAD family hydrolase [Myxococcota bacterium]